MNSWCFLTTQRHRTKISTFCHPFYDCSQKYVQLKESETMRYDRRTYKVSSQQLVWITQKVTYSQDIDYLLDIEESIFGTGIREGVGALSVLNHFHVLVWTHCPFNRSPLVSVYNY